MNNIIIDIIEEDYERAKKAFANDWHCDGTLHCPLANAASRTFGRPCRAGYHTIGIDDGNLFEAVNEDEVNRFTADFGNSVLDHYHNRKPWPPFVSHRFEFRPVANNDG
jgi:hypothetical protein